MHVHLARYTSCTLPIPPYGVIGNTWLVPRRVLTLIHRLSLLMAISCTYMTTWCVQRLCGIVMVHTVPSVSPLCRVYRWCTVVCDDSSGCERIRKTWNEWPSVQAVTSSVPLWEDKTHVHTQFLLWTAYMYTRHTSGQMLMLLFYSLLQHVQENWQSLHHLCPGYPESPEHTNMVIKCLSTVILYWVKHWDATQTGYR